MPPPLGKATISPAAYQNAGPDVAGTGFDYGDSSNKRVRALSEEARVEVISVDRYAWCECALVARTSLFRVTVAVLIVIHAGILTQYEPTASLDRLKFIVIADYCFAGVFLVEFCIRMAGKGKSGISDAYMYVDFCAVVLSIVSFSLLLPVLTDDATPTKDTSVWNGFFVLSLRATRLLRALKVIPPVKHLLKTAFARGVALANLVCLIAVVLAIFALICMQLFGGRLDISEDAPAPRLVFDSFSEAILTLFVVMTGEGWNAVFEEIQTGGTISKVFSFVLILFFLLAAVLLVEMFTSIIVDNFADAEDFKRQTAQELFHDVVQWYGIWQDMLRDRLRRLNEGMATLTAIRFLHNVSDRPVFHHPGALWDEIHLDVPAQPAGKRAIIGGVLAHSDLETGHSGSCTPDEGAGSGASSPNWNGSPESSIVAEQTRAGNSCEPPSVSRPASDSDGDEVANALYAGQVTLDSDPTTLHLARELILSRARRYSDATVVTIDS